MDNDISYKDWWDTYLQYNLNTIINKLEFIYA